MDHYRFKSRRSLSHWVCDELLPLAWICNILPIEAKGNSYIRGCLTDTVVCAVLEFVLNILWLSCANFTQTIPALRLRLFVERHWCYPQESGRIRHYGWCIFWGHMVAVEAILYNTKKTEFWHYWIYRQCREVCNVMQESPGKTCCQR
jgi:hypothetical protein